VLQDGQCAGAGRHLGVGAQHRKIGPLVVEFRQRPGAVGKGEDLEAQPRIGVLEDSGKPGGEAGFRALGIADGEAQRFGILQ
jgi:hypothetical protein